MTTAIASLILGLGAGALTFGLCLGGGERALVLIGAVLVALATWPGAWRGRVPGWGSVFLAINCTAIVTTIANGILLVLGVSTN